MKVVEIFSCLLLEWFTLSYLSVIVVSEFDEAVAKVKEVLSNDELDTKNGISLLDLKNQTVLNYLISLLTLILRKVSS